MKSQITWGNGRQSIFHMIVKLWHSVSEYISLPSLEARSLRVLVGIILLLCSAAKQSGDRMVVNAVAVSLVK